MEGTREGLAERRDDVMALGVDSVTDVVVVGSVPGATIGEGPGKGGGTVDTRGGGTAAYRSGRNSVDRREVLDTEDSGSEMSLAILVVVAVGILPMSEGEPMVEGSRG
jgi:hypothetical protein